jgi:hypothetical protein
VSRPGIGTFFDHEPKTLELRAEPAGPGYSFWYWTGSAADTGKVPGERVTAPDARVYVDANDTLRAMFLRTIPAWDDDVDRPARRGVRSAPARDGDGADSAPADLYEVTGAAPNGRPPLPGTSLAPADQGGPVSQRWWPTDPFTHTARTGLLASSGLRARVNVWQSHATATSVWVVICARTRRPRPVFPADAPAELALMDLDPPSGISLMRRNTARLRRRRMLGCRPQPHPGSFHAGLQGRRSLIVDTYTEEPRAGGNRG